jgi:signal peptidase II
VLRFTLSTNAGIVFGLRLVPTMVIAASLVAIAVVVYFFASSPRGALWLHVALGMILAGALGNLYDRLFSSVTLPGRPPSHREVRDFIDFGQAHYPYIFNIADVLLVVGVLLLLLSSFLYWRMDLRRETGGKKPAEG